MTHRTRPARTPLMLGLVALALLHACALAPRLHAAQISTLPAQPSVPDPSAYLGPVSKEWLLYALRAREAGEAALVRLVERRGVDSYPSAEDEKELRAAGATDRLIEAVRKYVATPAPSMGGFGPGAGGHGGGGPGKPGTVDYTRTFRPNEVTRKAMITSKPEPGYTEEARKSFVEGVVRLRVVLAASGEVTEIGVVKGLPDGLTEKTIAAARRIKFTPAEKDGRKVSQYAVIDYHFTVPLNESDVDERAIILAKPEAEYTEEARRNDVRGKVVLKVTLMSSGRVRVDSVEAGLPHGLTEKAAEAAERIEFEPARLGGRLVSQRATVEYVFAP
ncbi:MAG TPA: TonB family protein [Pyrinomonadaceae bacterium]